MQTFINGITEFSHWLFTASLKASVMIGILWIVQSLLRTRLPAKWQYALWGLLIIRLVLPIDPQSPMSLFNLSKDVPPPPQHLMHRALPVTAIPALPVQSSQNGSTINTNTKATSAIQKDAKKELNITPIQWIALIWMGILIGLLIWILWTNSKLLKSINACKPILDTRIQNIFVSAQTQIGTSRPVSLCSSASLSVPLIIGLFRPKILLPEQLLQALSEEQLEHIFLHELAHMRRGDLWTSLVITCLQALHWFNPFIWWAFRRMRADGEMACDALVLASLGQHRKITYGKTLISLLEAVRYRPTVPLAVALVDDRSIIQRRIQMIAKYSPPSRWWAAAVLAIGIVVGSFALTGAKQQAKITGTIQFMNNVQPDSLHVGVYHHTPHDWWVIEQIFDPLQFSTQTKQDFKFKVHPGRYTIAAWAYGFERSIAEVVVPDKESHIQIQFELEPLGLPKQPDKVLLTGQYCNWNLEKAASLIKSGSVWKLNQDVAIKKGQPYKFVLPDAKPEAPMSGTNLSIYGLNGGKRRNVKKWGTYDNVYDGESIVFDPSWYKIGSTPSRAIISGFPLQEQYQAIQDSLRVFDKYYHDVRFANRKVELEVREAAYAILTDRFERLETLFDPYFQPMFDEFWISNLMDMHPTAVSRGKAFDDANGDTTMICSLLQDSGFLDYLHDVWKRIENQEPTCVLVNGHCLEGITWMDFWLYLCPQVEEQIGLDRSGLYQYILDFIDATPNPEVKGHFLYHTARHYTETNPPEAEKSRLLINRLITNYPQDWYVTEGHAQGVLNSIKTSVGSKAPEFSVSDINGSTIQLSDYHGKYVLIDFWPPICEFDHPRNVNLRQLSQNISSDSLFILGVSDIGKEQTLEGVKRNQFDYPFTLEANILREIYGIPGTPSNVMVGPHGKIVSRNLLRKDMVKAVRKVMRQNEI